MDVEVEASVCVVHVYMSECGSGEQCVCVCACAHEWMSGSQRLMLNILVSSLTTLHFTDARSLAEPGFAGPSWSN